jgi:hypothetical protein
MEFHGGLLWQGEDSTQSEREIKMYALPEN